MIKIVESKPNGVVEFIADARTDVDNLPTDVSMGSDCFIIADSSVLMFGSDGIWHYVLDNSGGGGGGGEMSFDDLNNMYYTTRCMMYGAPIGAYDVSESNTIIIGSEEGQISPDVFTISDGPYIKGKVSQIKINNSVDIDRTTTLMCSFIPAADFNMEIDVNNGEDSLPIYIFSPEAPQETLEELLDLTSEKKLFMITINLSVDAETGDWDWEESMASIAPFDLDFMIQATQLLIN